MGRIKASRLFLLIGGLCILALTVGFITFLFGEEEFPAPFADPDEESGFGTYAWQVGAMALGAWLLWRVCLAVVLRIGSERDVASAFGAEDEWGEAEREEAYRAQPLMARCRACGEKFRSWDEALDHAERVHGRDRLPEEARALLERL